MLREGGFEQRGDLSSLQHPLQRPWTVQERIADFVPLKDKIYLAVNGRGLASLKISAAGSPHFEYFYDPLIFKYRTITTLLAGNGSLICHLYFNKMLNITGQENLKLQGISLLRLFPEEGIYQFISLPFQREHPDWESVGFVPENEDRFFLEWKYSGSEESRFRYSLFSISNMSEQPIDRLTFRRAYGFRETGGGNTPAALQSLFQTVIKRFSDQNLSTAFHFLLRSGDEPLLRRYAYQPEGFSEADNIRLFRIRIYKREGDYFLLTPDGYILKSGNRGEKLKSFQLPPLPENYHYFDLLIDNENFILSWEDASFTQVGAAGILIVNSSIF
ncbi:hypothetical protein ES703_106876 [subsurface metagenome]